MSLCAGLEPIEATPPATGRVCANCGRAVATYDGRDQHRRGGSWQARGPRPLSKAQVVAMLPDRITALEALVADQVLAGEAMRLQIAELTVAIEGFMARQPLILEVRPRHERQADGGRGGREELRLTGRALRKVVGA